MSMQKGPNVSSVCVCVFRRHSGQIISRVFSIDIANRNNATAMAVTAAVTAVQSDSKFNLQLF